MDSHAELLASLAADLAGTVVVDWSEYFEPCPFACFPRDQLNRLHRR